MCMTKVVSLFYISMKYHKESAFKLSKYTNISESRLLFTPVPVLFSSRQAAAGNTYNFFSLSADSHKFIFI